MYCYEDDALGQPKTKKSFGSTEAVDTMPKQNISFDPDYDEDEDVGSHNESGSESNGDKFQCEREKKIILFRTFIIFFDSDRHFQHLLISLTMSSIYLPYRQTFNFLSCNVECKLVLVIGKLVIGPPPPHRFT